ncbi:MAG TPA: FAD:protein FMN transferase [Thermoanaerobaculia bacterium]|nr:FAD:protein FMN transferase [Thermoanaerobaculia bacterium]
MRTAAIIAALAVVVPATTEASARARYLMGTVCEVAVQGSDADAQAEKMFAEAKRIELMLSTWIDDSELIRVNRGAQPGGELRTLLDRATEWSKKTGGAFDPRWGRAFGDKGYEAGAFGKGYALDRMLALTKGEAVLDFGGQLLVRGRHEVAVASPRDRKHPVLAFTLTDASLSTSSGSEQPGHIYDPRTGESLPARGSVSVIAGDATTADILSTALYVMGEEEGLRWADAHGVAAIFINDANEVRRSARAPRTLTVLDSQYKLKD